MVEIIFAVFSVFYWGAFLAIMLLIFRYAINRYKRVKEMTDARYVCIGCSFISGPVMVPPEDVFHPETVKRWRDSAKATQAEMVAEKKAMETLAPEAFRECKAERAAERRHREMCQAIRDAGDNARPKGGIFSGFR